MKTGIWPDLTLLVILVTALITGVAGAGKGISEDNLPNTESDVLLARGQQVYTRYCALCHGDNGEGYAADNANALGNQDFLVSVSDEFLWRSIANGRPGTAMAAHDKRYGGPLDETDIDSLVSLIRSWQLDESLDMTAEPILGDPVSGRIAYDQSCAVCHGYQGQGVTATSLNNPEFLSSASDEQIRLAISNGRRGTPMSAYRDQISEDTIDDLVALIRSWKREVPERFEVPEFAEFPEVVLNPDGPPPQFSLREGRYVSAEQLDTAIRNGARLILLDTRPPSDWYLAHIPGAIPAPAYDPESTMMLLPEDDTWIISYCACPHKYSDQMTDALRSNGYKNTAVLDEGVRWWQHNGYPIKYGP
ncbi:MAG: c-type cytochrome [Gammaproteobacteria bacterium]|nr:c-type cytochrome [Gammaproteobacteria bacterium]